MSRLVCQFSCGAASAVATKLALSGSASTPVAIVNAYLKEEHPDNRRFLEDCEAWYGTAIVRLSDERYGGSAREVFRRERYMKGLWGRPAPCAEAGSSQQVRAAWRHDGARLHGRGAGIASTRGSTRTTTSAPLRR
jgi:hypothetical protein